jgi:membrane fusion protein, multidrug efflux system
MIDPMKESFLSFQHKFAGPIGAVVLAILFTGCSRGGESPNGPGQMPPLPVTTVKVYPRNIDVQATYTGRIRGVREVEVRARVGGILEERLYREGQFVEQGAPLFRIEREPYEIALHQAEAELANTRAADNHASREWRRISALFDQNAVSERERDRALSEHELAQARLKLSEARVAEARLNLGYTTVLAPIAGPTGMESLSEGSLVERGTLLTTIVQNDPVQVRFSLPEPNAATQRAARGEKAGSDANQRLEVHLLHTDGTVHARTGHVDFIDSTIAARTGSVQARAIFENPGGELVPGQFVRVRLTLQRLENVFAIDPVAVGEGDESPRVFVVKSDNTVEARDVRLGPVVDGRQVVMEGLEPGDQLVVSGLVMLQPGMPVSPGNQDKE